VNADRRAAIQKAARDRKEINVPQNLPKLCTMAV
jgi:hypothetical protein